MTWLATAVKAFWQLLPVYDAVARRAPRAGRPAPAPAPPKPPTVDVNDHRSPYGRGRGH